MRDPNLRLGQAEHLRDGRTVGIDALCIQVDVEPIPSIHATAQDGSMAPCIV